tara:strand:- start:139 stop:312 length:174 start_codon:yes stop_codon:yes gene_type:complete
MNKKVIQEFYFLALQEISLGASIKELEDTIKIYEQEQQFEACAGILKAINESKSSNN